MSTLVAYAMQFVGTPYVWGVRDCSWFVQEILKSVGLDPKGDQNAQMLYTIFHKEGVVPRGRGALCFYGKSVSTITHVAFMINEVQVIEAGGGDSTTVTKELAEKKDGAFVRIRPYNHRPDLIGIAMPDYPDWVLHG